MGVPALTVAFCTWVNAEEVGKITHFPVFPWKRFVWILQKLLPEGQASNFTGTRNWLWFSLGKPEDTLPTSPSPLQVTIVSPWKQLVHIYSPAFMAATWEMRTQIIWLARGASIHEFWRTVANKWFLTGYIPQSFTTEGIGKLPFSQSFPEVVYLPLSLLFLLGPL